MIVQHYRKRRKKVKFPKTGIHIMCARNCVPRVWCKVRRHNDYELCLKKHFAANFHCTMSLQYRLLQIVAAATYCSRLFQIPKNRCNFPLQKIAKVTDTQRSIETVKNRVVLYYHCCFVFGDFVGSECASPGKRCVCASNRADKSSAGGEPCSIVALHVDRICTWSFIVITDLLKLK